MRIAVMGIRGVPANFGGSETAVEEIGSRLVYRFRLSDEPAVVAKRIAAWAQRDRAYQLRRRVGKFYSWRAVRQQYIEPLVNRLASRQPRNGK